MDFSALSFADLIGYDISSLDSGGLAAYQAELRARFDVIKGAEGVTQAQVAEAEQLAARFGQVRDAVAAAEAEAPATEEQVASLAELSLDPAVGEDPEEGEEPTEGEGEPEDQGQPTQPDQPDQPAPPAQPEQAAKKTTAAVTRPRPTAVATLAGTRPAAAPAAATVESMVSITAAADTGYATGAPITMEDLGQAAVNRLSPLPVPEGDGTREDWRRFPVGNIALPYPEDLIVDPPTMTTEQIHEVLVHAGDETRLEGESLVASNGWGAPSEQLYDLCGGEVLDGILSIAEVQVNRGGFKHTTGIDFSTVFAATGVGGIQTEAQAIAGTAKNTYEVPAPTFVDERLDAVYTNIRVPILLEVGYPEMVTSVMHKSLLAHAYKVNASVLTRLITIAGAATDITPDFASVSGELLMGLDLIAEQTRQKWRLGVSASLEVVLPVWAKDVLRGDFGLRTGRDGSAITDEMLMAHFSVRHLNVQFVWGWQELTGSELTWPATVEALVYPAGAVVKGASNVINLSAVYDAASLATNIYTGMFMEQGLLVAKMCQEVRRITVPVTGAFTGKTGAASL